MVSDKRHLPPPCHPVTSVSRPLSSHPQQIEAVSLVDFGETRQTVATEAARSVDASSAFAASAELGARLGVPNAFIDIEAVVAVAEEALFAATRAFELAVHARRVVMAWLIRAEIVVDAHGAALVRRGLLFVERTGSGRALFLPLVLTAHFAVLADAQDTTLGPELVSVFVVLRVVVAALAADGTAGVFAL